MVDMRTTIELTCITRLGIAIISGFCVFLLAGIVDLRAQNLPINLKDNWEIFRESSPIGSAGLSIGMMSGVDSSVVSADGIYVHLPIGFTGTLSLEIVSIDGLYEANPEFKIEEVTERRTFLRWPTEYGESLSSYRYSDVAVLAYLEETKGNEVLKHYVATSWPEARNTERIIVYVNSDLNTYLILESDGETIRKKCTRIRDEKAISFNCRCEIQLDPLTEGQELFIAQKIRKDGMITIKKNKIDLLKAAQ